MMYVRGGGGGHNQAIGALVIDLSAAELNSTCLFLLSSFNLMFTLFSSCLSTSRVGVSMETHSRI